MSARSVVHTIASMDRRIGGPARSVSGLCSALEGAGLRVALVTRRPRDPAEPVPWTGTTALAPAGRLRGWRAFGRLVDEMLERTRADVLHDHGMWLLTNHVTARVATRRGRPRVVSPRGMMDRWALDWHPRRKRIAWRLYQGSDLASADLLHATSAAEAARLRAEGLRRPIAVVPNGVRVPASVERPPAGRSPRVALFLSRIHPKKGLLDLLRAWATLRPAGWVLRVGGALEGAHGDEVRATLRREGLSRDVETLGAVDEDAKGGVFADADVFVLPTRSENFGMVVGEALAAGVPVLTTTAAPWETLEREACGWWVPPGPDGVADGLRRALALPDEERRRMGERGRALVRERFAWDSVGRRMRAAYDWLLGGGSPPPDVVPEGAAVDLP